MNESANIVLADDIAIKDRCNESVITLTTEKTGIVEIHMKGSGAFSIDWGDDSIIETFCFDTIAYLTLKSSNYASTSSRTITIAGENIRPEK